MINKTLQLLGLAYRASKITIGTDETLDKIKDKKVCLIFLDKSLSINTIKELKSASEANGIKLLDRFTKEDLSHANGKKNISVIGIIDE